MRCLCLPLPCLCSLILGPDLWFLYPWSRVVYSCRQFVGYLPDDKKYIEINTDVRALMSGSKIILIMQISQYLVYLYRSLVGKIFMLQVDIELIYGKIQYFASI